MRALIGRGRALGNTWVTDMRHFLDGAGAMPDGMPGPALDLALFLGAIVAWVTSGRSAADHRMNVACRRSPGSRCKGHEGQDLQEGRCGRGFPDARPGADG